MTRRAYRPRCTDSALPSPPHVSNPLPIPPARRCAPGGRPLRWHSSVSATTDRAPTESRAGTLILSRIEEGAHRGRRTAGAPRSATTVRLRGSRVSRSGLRAADPKTIGGSGSSARWRRIRT